MLVSRQFVDMSRIRIEGLLAAFPKLVGTGKQHTYIETENVRYVYQPIEALYLLLVTNKQSNILEDLDTLRMLSKLVSFSWQFFIIIQVPKLSFFDILSKKKSFCFNNCIITCMDVDLSLDPFLSLACSFSHSFVMKLYMCVMHTSSSFFFFLIGTFSIIKI